MITNGSEKQIAWATEIRASAITNLTATIEMADETSVKDAAAVALVLNPMLVEWIELADAKMIIDRRDEVSSVPVRGLGNAVNRVNMWVDGTMNPEGVSAKYIRIARQHVAGEPIETRKTIEESRFIVAVADFATEFGK